MLIKSDNIIIDYALCDLDSPSSAPTITSYILDNDGVYKEKRRPAVIICPGGGYTIHASHEAEPVAIQFNAAGFHAFVVHYSVAPMRFPAALLELSMAVSMVRAQSDEYNIDPERIVICGFSAGGHLAASLGVYWHESFIQRILGFENNENQPNGLILGYPVISGKPEITHQGSMQSLLGRYPDEKEIAMFSLEDYVSEFTPSTFLWHTSDDNAVSVENSLCFASALRRQEIPFELHIYPYGDHGISLASDVTAQYLGQIVPRCQNWAEMAGKFIKNL